MTRRPICLLHRKTKPKRVGSVVVVPLGGSINCCYSYLTNNFINYLLTTDLTMSILVRIVSVIYRFRIYLTKVVCGRRYEASITVLYRLFKLRMTFYAPGIADINNS